MIFHVMVQDKFIDGFIEDVYEIGEKDNNRFWIRGSKKKKSFIQTKKNVEYIGTDINVVKLKIRTELHEDDVLVFHWYDIWAGELALSCRNVVASYLWGGDFYAQPFWAHANWLFDKKTLSLVKQVKLPKIKFRKNVFKIFDRCIEILLFRKSLKKKIALRNKQIQRLDYILCAEQNYGEVELLKKTYMGFFKAVHLNSFYEYNLELASKKEKNIKSKKLKILLGNSADPSNNHLDAFEKLKQIKNIEVYCPLSYGDMSFKNKIKEAGFNAFQNNFFPVEEYMDRRDYIMFLNEIDIAFMYHNRSQAFGNIATCLALGKPVFLKVNNPLSKFLENMGLSFYDVNEVGRLNLVELLNEEQLRRSDNIDKLKKNISKEKRQLALKQAIYILNK